MKAAVLALKAGAESEALKAEVPRRSAEAIVIVVVVCGREEMLAEGKITEKRKAPGKMGGSPSARSPEKKPQRIAGIRVNGLQGQKAKKLYQALDK